MKRIRTLALSLITIFIVFVLMVAIFGKSPEENTDSERADLVIKEPVKDDPVIPEPAKEEPEKAEQLKAEQLQAEQEKAEQLKAEQLQAEQEKAEQLKAEQLQAEQEKAEQLKAEQLQAEQEKAEQLKAEQLKAEQAKAEQLKAEQLQAEQEKAEQLKAEQLQAEQEKGEQLKAEQEKAEQAKAEQLKAEQEKAEQAKGEQLKAEQEKAEQAKGEQLKAEQEKAAQLKADQEKEEQIKAEQLKAEQLKAEQLKAEQQEAESVKAEPEKFVGFFKGPKVCEECHEPEDKVWKKTKHFTLFRTAHREPKDANKPSPKKILAAVGGEKRMKRNEACSLCHYTLEQDDADSKPVARSGTSCEKCHGASSEWLAIHDDYGGKEVKEDQETPEHKKERFEKSTAVGLIWPSMFYQVAENCMTCHGLAHPDLTGDKLAKMLGAGHPIKPDFELVKYSQGTVRHRYYPPDREVNAEMTPAQQAELLVTGHAAALVSAKGAMSKSKEAKYIDAQNKRVENAKAVLSAIKSIPEAAAFLASPNRDNAFKLVNAIKGKDLSGEVGSMLPAKADFK